LIFLYVQVDDQLRQLVAKHGPKRWSVIAKELKVKSSKQCRRRWKNVLNATRKTGAVSSAPDRCMLQSEHEHRSLRTISQLHLLCVPSGDWTKEEDQVCCAVQC
jgi:Myb-like DNA-binding domain